MRKIFFILTFSTYLFAQDTQSSRGVELPEFVITGTERVSLPTVTKPKAELVSIISEDYIKPTYSPEELPIAEISNPVKKDVQLYNVSEFYKGRLTIGAGFWVLPAGELYLGNKFNNGLWYGRASGFNGRDYNKDATDASINSSGLELGTSFFVSHNSSFLPGTEIKLKGNYLHEGYKFYGSDTPGLKRDNYQGNISLDISNLQNKNVMFSVGIAERLSSIKDVNLKENVFTGKAFLELKLENFSVGGNMLIKNQDLKNNLGIKSNHNYFGISPFIAFTTRNAINLHVGFKFAYADTNFFSPFAIASTKITKHLSLHGEYNPASELLTISDLLGTNRFLKISRNNFLLKESMNLKGAIKYEYETFFEIDAGAYFDDYKHYPIFSDKNEKGKFEVYSTEATRYAAFVNLLFHPGPNGTFYGNVNLQSFTNDDGNELPYNAALTADLSYARNLIEKLFLKTTLDFSSAVYTDSVNTGATKLPSRINLHLYAGYELWNNFNLFAEFNNILFKKNFTWKNYQEHPFDVLFGINYKW